MVLITIQAPANGISQIGMFVQPALVNGALYRLVTLAYATLGRLAPRLRWSLALGVCLWLLIITLRMMGMV